MLLGSDALRDIMRWHRWRELLALVQPAVVVRPPDDHASVTRFLKEFGATQGFADAPTWLLSLPPVELASTEIRRAIAAGMRPAGIAEDAWREISARGLYGFGEALESNAIEVHIHHLRRKLGESLIKTVRGVGYFVPQQDPPA